MTAGSAEAAGSRADFDSLIPWARRLYADGAGPTDVIRAIYGVDLPTEFYALARAEVIGPEPPYGPMVHPWQLLVAADPAATPYTGDIWARRQERQPAELRLRLDRRRAGRGGGRAVAGGRDADAPGSELAGRQRRLTSQTVMTTLARACSVSTYRIASAAAASG